MELGHFYKHFVKNTRKKGPAGKRFLAILLDILKTTFWTENLTQRSTQSRPFFPKSRHFFQFLKKDRGGPSLLSLVAWLWLWLNMHQYPWIPLNILENAWLYCSDYARALNISGHPTCLTGFWRCLQFWMCQGSEYGTVEYAGLHKCLNVAQYPSNLNMPQYALMSLIMPEHGWVLLNVPEYPWKCLNNYSDNTRVSDFCLETKGSRFESGC